MRTYHNSEELLTERMRGQEVQCPELKDCPEIPSLTLAVRKLGYDLPTNEQKDAVTEFVKGKDVFVSLPTGNSATLGSKDSPLIAPW